MRTLPLLTMTIALAACATGPTLTTPQRLDLYRQHAGAPTMTFRLERTMGMHSWTPLGDQALAVWTTASRGYLLELRTRCSGLGTASRISITNRMNLVTARFDGVVPRTAGGMAASVNRNSCRIETIRPLDRTGLRDAKREMREAEFVERPADATEETTPPPENPAQ